MSLTQAEVEHIALLARLELTDEEKQRFRSSFRISSSMPPSCRSWIPAMNLNRVQCRRAARLRADEPQAGLTTRQSAGQRAADAKDDQFRVPPVLE